MKYTIEIDGQTMVGNAFSIDDLRNHIPSWEEFFNEPKKFTIEDLRNGKCAVKNDGTQQELREVVGKAFPEDYEPKSADATYYERLRDGLWEAVKTTHLPTQSVKDFLPFRPKRGDKVLVRDHNCEEWEPRIFLTEIQGGECPFLCVTRFGEEHFDEGREFLHISWKQMKPLEPEEMTLKQVCKELRREIKIVK